MKKTRFSRVLALILSALLAAISLSCSGGGGSSSGVKSGSSLVTITMSGLQKTGRSAAAVPAAISEILISVSGPDMVTIVRSVTVSGRDTVTETIDIPSGANRRFLARAVTAEGNTLYWGDAFSDLDGTPKSVDILMTLDLSGPWTFTAQNPAGGDWTILVNFVQTGRAFTLSGSVVAERSSLSGSGSVTGNGFQASATGTPVCGSAPNITLTGSLSPDGKTLTGSYSKTGGCTSGSGAITAVRGTPVTPPPPPANGVLGNLPPGDYSITVHVCVAGFCSAGTPFVLPQVDLGQFTQSLVDILNAAINQSFTADCSQSGCSCIAPAITYKPWDGTSFTITDTFSVTCGTDTSAITIEYVGTKL